MPIEKEYIEEIIVRALQSLYANDQYLIAHYSQNNEGGNPVHNHERTIVSQFGRYLENIIHTPNTPLSEHHLDCEYNRNMDMVKALPSFLNGVYPDLIIHERGSNYNNVLVMEFKTWWNHNTGRDKDKLAEFTDLDGEYQYEYGVLVTIGQTLDDCRMRWFIEGEEVDE